MKSTFLNGLKINPLELDKNITNTEGSLYLIEQREKFKKVYKVLKEIKAISKEGFDDKIYTINELINNREELSKLDIVIPEKIKEINELSLTISYIMPYVNGINLTTLLNNTAISDEYKIRCLKQIGNLLDTMHEFRKISSIKDFYLNDFHEGNFVVENETNRVLAVDLDSCRINANNPFRSRYLQRFYIPDDLEPKYQQCESNKSCYEANENTEIFCFCIMILKYLYGSESILSQSKYYDYLQYLEDIKFPKKLVEIFSELYTLKDNENPGIYLEELTPEMIKKSNKKLFLERIK